MEDETFISVGEVVGVHGVRGALKVYLYGGLGSDLMAGERLVLRVPKGETGHYVVAWSRPHKRVRLVGLEAVGDRQAAEALVGREVLVEKDRLPELQDGEYYWFELMGLAVSTEDGRYLGLLEAIIPTGSNDVYVVRDGGSETLVPALATVVRRIDLAEKTMQVALPEGL